MSTPCFEDFDKHVSDLFSEDFYAGRLDLSLQSRANNGAEFVVDATASHDGHGIVKTTGGLETSVTCYDHGLTIKERWDIDQDGVGILSSDIETDDFFVNGLNVKVGSAFTPSTCKRTARIDLSLARRRAFVSMQAGVGLGIRGSSAFRFGNMLIGGRGVFDSIPGRITDSAVGAAYEGSDFTMCARLTNGKQYTASVYHRISPELQWGVSCGWSFRSPSTVMAIAIRQQIDKGSFWKAKLDNQALVCLSYGLKLSDYFEATISANFDFKAGYGQARRQLGLGLQFHHA